MERESYYTSKEISDYLDKMSIDGFNLKNSILLINSDYFLNIPEIKPNAISELEQTIYGVDFKLVKNLKENFILTPK
jgi:hypothetical protein